MNKTAYTPLIMRSWPLLLISSLCSRRQHFAREVNPLTREGRLLTHLVARPRKMLNPMQ
jgi:hypothetical protein